MSNDKAIDICDEVFNNITWEEDGPRLPKDLFRRLYNAPYRCGTSTDRSISAMTWDIVIEHLLYKAKYGKADD